MPPYKYFAMKFVNQWTSKERDLHITLSKRTIPEDAIAKSLHYFQVARTFKNLEERENRAFIAEQIIEFSRHLTQKNFHEKVEGLSKQFENKFKSKNLSAASKLLWLRRKSPVLIFDKWAKLSLEKMEQKKIVGYEEYSVLWRKHYCSHRHEINSAAHGLIEVKEYSGLWNAVDSEFKETILSDWFSERVFDMYLLFHGKNG